VRKRGNYSYLSERSAKAPISAQTIKLGLLKMAVTWSNARSKKKGGE